ncbi:TRAP transporter large permease [Chloroflexota bacterium]
MLSELSPITAGFIGIAIFFILMAAGMPVGFSMAIVGFAGFAYLVSLDGAFAKIGYVPFRTISNYDFAVVPLFMFMAHIVFSVGLGKDLYDFVSKWLGWLPGGLAIATVGACAIFAAVSASSIATAVTLGLVALPEMKKYNYDPKLSTAAVAAGGTMGVLIPPSAALILYGILTEESIGKLFMAGIIPGILEAVFYIILILILCRFNPRLGPRGPQTSFREKMAAFGKVGEIVGLIALVLGGIFIGWFTPTEAGAVGAFGAVLFSLLRKRLNWKSFKDACINTAEAVGMIYALMIGAFILNYFMAVTTIPFELANIASGLPLPPMGIMGFIILVYLMLGCVISGLAMVLLTIPVFFPLVLAMGFDPIWFGIIIVRVMEIAAITPPVGINVYAISGVAKDVPMSTIFKGVLPFVLADILHVIMLLFFPQVTLWLPTLMK